MSTCWPALWPAQPGTSSTTLLVLGVSGTTSITSARCQESLRGCTAVNLVSPITLLAPGVAVVVVAQALPETWFVVVHEPQASNPLGALPEIEVRDEQARRAAVLGLQWLPLVGVGDPRLAIRHVLEGHVGRVSPIAEG